MENFAFIAYLAGCIGNLAFGICYLPQIIKTFHNKTADGISLLLIVLNIIGNFFGWIYLFSTDCVTGCWHYPIFANYTVALILNVTLLCMRYYYRQGGTMRAINIHIHEYPAEVPNMTDGEHVHRSVTMITSLMAGSDVIKGNGAQIPIYSTDFNKEWGGHYVIWIYTDELIDRVMDTRKD